MSKEIKIDKKKYGVDRRTISDILNGKKLYLEKLCK